MTGKRAKRGGAQQAGGAKETEDDVAIGEADMTSNAKIEAGIYILGRWEEKIPPVKWKFVQLKSDFPPGAPVIREGKAPCLSR